MARCLILRHSEVETGDDRLLIRLVAGGMNEIQKFEEIIARTYPMAHFERVGAPTRGGLLGIDKTIALEGGMVPGGAQEVADFLRLVGDCLTIEDSLDESHALGYHQSEGDDGELAQSRIGAILYRAKYKPAVYPAAAGIVRAALYSFIQSHPRYRSADCIGALPPHESWRANSLCRQIVTKLASDLSMRPVAVIRLATRPKQKEIIDQDRQLGVDKRFENQRDSMEVREDLSGLSIILIDDLYGSGGSMWDAARAARDAGAEVVLGLAVTKQRLYEGVSALRE